MKKIFTFLLICISFNLFAQNVYDRKVSFEYIRLPLEPLNKSLKSYEGGVVLEYLNETASRKNAYSLMVQNIEKQYDQDMKNYDQSVKDAGAKYAKDMANYNAMIKTVANPQTVVMPQLILPPKPEKNIPPDNNYYPKEYNPATLTDTYINLQGYEKGFDNSVRITFLLKGFQYQEPQLKMDEVTKTKDGNTYKEKQYYYQIPYRHIMGLKVETPIEGVIFNDYFKELERYNIAQTQKYLSETELHSAFNRNTFLSGLEDKVLAENMRYVNDQLNNKFGFTRIRATEEINLVHPKKYKYDDYQQAFEAAVTGFNQLGSGIDKSIASQNLSVAISSWENCLKESQPANKKARINENVTKATLFNIALVAIYAEDFIKAEIYLNKIFAMDSSKKELRRVEQLRTFLKDMQSRAEAYKSK